MKPLNRLCRQQVAPLRGVVFDIDGTLLTDGKLTAAAVDALWQMSAAGLRLIACTGRSARWGALLMRILPLQACVVENGALAFVAHGRGALLQDAAAGDRSRRKAALRKMAEQLIGRFSDLVYTDDNDGRISDIAFDVGELHHMPQQRVMEVCRYAHRLGAHTFTSAIHLHITLAGDDKTSGTLRVLQQHFGDDPTEALYRYAFVGDSGNDAACFNAFAITFGVANIAPYIHLLTCPPRFLCSREQGAGFAQMASRIVALRGQR